MGNFEKLIVLVVLFAAAVVLAVNFTGGDDVKASDPLAGAEEVLTETGGGEAPARSGLLSAGLDPAPEPFAPASPASPARSAGLQPAPSATPDLGAGLLPGSPLRSEPSALAASEESDPTRPILVDTVGLRPSFLDEYMVYVVGEGDTWTGLAQRFYQDGRYTRNLMQANDDPSALTPGLEILVPVYDVIAADASRSAGATLAEEPVRSSAPVRADAPAARGSTTPPATSSAPKPKASTAVPAGEYVVQPGDTLSDIALAAFGSASRWKDILAANEDRLAKPENLRAGMKLTIPAGGKVPAAAVARGEAKAATKPEAKSASASTSSTKKKKVL